MIDEEIKELTADGVDEEMTGTLELTVDVITELTAELTDGILLLTVSIVLDETGTGIDDDVMSVVVEAMRLE